MRREGAIRPARSSSLVSTRLPTHIVLAVDRAEEEWIRIIDRNMIKSGGLFKDGQTGNRDMGFWCWSINKELWYLPLQLEDETLGNFVAIRLGTWTREQVPSDILLRNGIYEVDWLRMHPGFTRKIGYGLVGMNPFAPLSLRPRIGPVNEDGTIPMATDQPQLPGLLCKGMNALRHQSFVSPDTYNPGDPQYQRSSREGVLHSTGGQAEERGSFNSGGQGSRQRERERERKWAKEQEVRWQQQASQWKKDRPDITGVRTWRPTQSPHFNQPRPGRPSNESPGPATPNPKRTQERPTPHRLPESVAQTERPDRDRAAESSYRTPSNRDPRRVSAARRQEQRENEHRRLLKEELDRRPPAFAPERTGESEDTAIKAPGFDRSLRKKVRRDRRRSQRMEVEWEAQKEQVLQEMEAKYDQERSLEARMDLILSGRESEANEPRSLYLQKAMTARREDFFNNDLRSLDEEEEEGSEDNYEEDTGEGTLQSGTHGVTQQSADCSSDKAPNLPLPRPKAQFSSGRSWFNRKASHSTSTSTPHSHGQHNRDPSDQRTGDHSSETQNRPQGSQQSGGRRRD